MSENTRQILARWARAGRSSGGWHAACLGSDPCGRRLSPTAPLLLLTADGADMARSLTVKHEETPATSPLLTAFLLLACAWMAASALSAASADAGPATTLSGAMINGQ